MSEVRSDEQALQELAGDLAAWLTRQSQLGLRTVARREVQRQTAPQPAAPREPSPPARAEQPQQPQTVRSREPQHAAARSIAGASADPAAASNHAIGRRVEEFSQSVSEVLAAGRPAPAEKGRASTLPELRALLGACERCGLCEQRRNLVFGDGAARPRVMFVGDMPTADEDASGVTLAGAEGELLRKMLQAMKLPEDQVYVTSVVKCRSQPVRRPQPDEVRRCRPVLAAQIRIAEPEVIVVLGGSALAALKPDDSLTAEDRGKWMELAGVPMMPTFHPTLLLQKPELKKAAWQDLQLVMKRLGLS